MDVRKVSTIRAGRLRTEAAADLGLNPGTGRAWFRQAGGVAPSDVLALPRGRFLSIAEREEIFGGVERGDSINAMARALGRSPSTLLRELRRNMRQQYRTRSRLDHQADAHRTAPWDYRPSLAQQLRVAM